jgi:adenine-specific DNA-methyltransferase
MNKFDEAFEEINVLVSRFQTGIDHYTSPSYQEYEARQDFIDDFFTCLGWDVRHRNQQNPYEQEVKVEKAQKQQHAKAQKRADYAFSLAPKFNEIRFFAEAKKPSVGLRNSDHYFQTIRYGWNANTPLAILTDFEELHILDCRIKPDLRYIFNGYHTEYKYTDYINKEKFAEIYWLFSREAVVNNSLESFAINMPKPKGKVIQKALFTGGYQAIDESFLGYIDSIRENLAKAFKRNDEHLNGEELTEAVQRTIDRLVFIRFLEDKMIEPQSHVNNWTGWKDFISECRKLDVKYNGIVFKKHFIDDQHFAGAEERLFLDICNELSDLNSPYDFNYIPIHILGSIYERFLGKIVIATAKRVHIEEKPEVRKAGGVYYTPKYIVDYIVKNTVGKLINGKTPKEISKMRFGDIACGSGSFLIGIYDLLLTYHKKYYRDKLGDKKEIDGRSEDYGNTIFKDSQWILTLKLKQDILLNNIFGVDIDSQAVEVTQLSLFLKMLEDETLSTTQSRQGALFSKVLPDLTKNIICGNSLISTDIFSNHLFSFEEERKINAMDFDVVFPSIMKEKGFDAIIGNPPYVRQESLGDQKGYFEKKYLSYHGMADLYTYFIEKGIKLLKNGGLFSVIVGSKWMRVKYGGPLRKWLKTQGLVELIDFEDLAVFKGATTYTCIPTMCKNSSNNEKSFSAISISTLDFQSLEDYVDNNSIMLSLIELDDDAWTLSNSAVKDLVKEIYLKGSPLKNYVNGNIYYGIKTGLNEAFIINEEQRSRLIEQDHRSAELIKPFLIGKSIRRYNPLNKGLYLILIRKGFTNEMGNHPKSPFNWLVNEYPAIASHLKKFQDKAEKRYDKGDFWWELRTCDYYNQFEKEKILWPGISAEVSAFTLDSEGFYGNDNTQLIISSDKYLLGILNSKLSQFILKETCDKVQGGFYRLKMIYIERLPIKIPETTEESKLKNCIETAVEKILEVKRLLEHTRTERDKTYLKNKAETLDKGIDLSVYKLYNLSQEQINIIES